MTKDIRYEKHGHARLITIDRAAIMNSLDFAANDDARVAEITGAGAKAFRAGAVLKERTDVFRRQRPARFNGK
ncbi:MAG: hypothetical protein AB7G15_15680 [Alphaproteobacteria bacterium]